MSRTREQRRGRNDGHTDAALLQAKLAHAERMATIGRLVSGVAHEVNNPLAAILGFTDLLLENPRFRHRRTNRSESFCKRRSARNISCRTAQLCAAAPRTARSGSIRRHLRQTIKLRSYDFSSHGVEVVEEFDEHLPATIGDSQQLQQVFLNIVNNAYDAIQEAGRREKSRCEQSAWEIPSKLRLPTTEREFPTLRKFSIHFSRQNPPEKARGWA